MGVTRVRSLVLQQPGCCQGPVVSWKGLSCCNMAPGPGGLKYKLSEIEHLQAVLFEMAEGQGPVVQQSPSLFISPCDTG